MLHPYLATGGLSWSRDPTTPSDRVGEVEYGVAETAAVATNSYSMRRFSNQNTVIARIMSDSFDLWGASLCWGYEDLPAAPRLEKQGAAEEKASSPPAAERGVRDSLQDRPQGNILSTQDIDDHEASFDCGAQEAFHVQDSAVSSTVRSATKRASSEGAISLTSPARASEQSGAVEKAPSPFREARRSLACDDTQIYVLPPSSGAGARGI
eukprot:s7232_g1.t1